MTWQTDRHKRTRNHVSCFIIISRQATDGQTSKQRNTTSLTLSLRPSRESHRERESKTIPLIDGMGHSGKLLPRHTERESFVHTYTRTHDTQPTHKTQAGRKADMTSAGAVDRASGHIQTRVVSGRVGELVLCDGTNRQVCLWVDTHHVMSTDALTCPPCRKASKMPASLAACAVQCNVCGLVWYGTPLTRPLPPSLPPSLV